VRTLLHSQSGVSPPLGFEPSNPTHRGLPRSVMLFFPGWWPPRSNNASVASYPVASGLNGLFKEEPNFRCPASHLRNCRLSELSRFLSYYRALRVNYRDRFRTSDRALHDEVRRSRDAVYASVGKDLKIKSGGPLPSPVSVFSQVAMDQYTRGYVSLTCCSTRCRSRFCWFA
jgi:hypothetical protein